MSRSSSAASRIAAALLLAFSLALPHPVSAYSVLTHEEVVDLAWLPQIVPLLKARYPGLTGDQLRAAHAYAYGGSVIQDIGYYPFGSHQFSDMTHYVRSGDFVAALIRDSADANELAFALGALAHYCGDVDGHPTVNLVVPQQNPKLRARFGPVVTYDENPVAHVRTEFGFDVVEVAHGRYNQQNYRDFIGFQVAKRLLERAFLETYAVPLTSVMHDEDLAIGSYRWAVSKLIPQMTTIALLSYRKDVEAANPGFNKRLFLYRIRRTEFEREYGTQYIHPGFGSRLLAFFIRILPKIGPLKDLEIKVASPAQQDLYLKSLNLTVDRYDGYLKVMREQTSILLAQPGVPPPALPEIDLDTGQPSSFGEYQLADQTCGQLLDTLLHKPPAQAGANPVASAAPAAPIPAALDRSFLAFYAGSSARPEPAWYQKKPAAWRSLQSDLKLLDAARPASAPSSQAATFEHGIR